MPSRQITAMGKKFKSASGAGVPVAPHVDEEADFPRGGTDRPPPRGLKGKGTKDPGRKRKHGGTHADDTELDFTSALTFQGKAAPKSVEVLRYKNLSVGMKLLGTVTDVRRKDLIVSLPGGLRGFVPAAEAVDSTNSAASNGENGGKAAHNETSDSAKPQKKKKQQQQQHSSSSSAPAATEAWRKLFQVGQLVPCTVTKLEKRKASSKLKKDSKRVELSLQLSRLHKGFTVQSLHKGLPLFAYVNSVEDHGYGLKMGVDQVTGFLLHRDHVEGGEGGKLLLGQLVHGIVADVNTKQRSFILQESGKTLATSSVRF